MRSSFKEGVPQPGSGRVALLLAVHNSNYHDRGVA